MAKTKKTKKAKVSPEVKATNLVKQILGFTARIQDLEKNQDSIEDLYEKRSNLFCDLEHLLDV